MFPPNIQKDENDQDNNKDNEYPQSGIPHPVERIFSKQKCEQTGNTHMQTYNLQQ